MRGVTRRAVLRAVPTAAGVALLAGGRLPGAVPKVQDPVQQIVFTPANGWNTGVPFSDTVHFLEPALQLIVTHKPVWDGTIWELVGARGRILRYFGGVARAAMGRSGGEREHTWVCDVVVLMEAARASCLAVRG